MSNIKNIQKMLKGRLRENVSLKDYNTWKIGGKAEYFYEPSDIKDLKLFLELLQNTPITFLGNGSNVLIRDGGISGCVICLKNTLNNYFVKDEEYIFEAGLSCMKMAQITARENYEGLEYLCGIPGSLGGALAMNAGCYGGNIWDHVLTVSLINNDGEIIKKNKNDFIISYRNTSLEENNFFISAVFKLRKNKLKNSLEKIKEFLQDRRSKQPTGLLSCGSVFKNPKNLYAAKLIESIGLKGYKIGGACISEKHANFIISDKSTKSIDIEKLINFTQKEVFKKKEVVLETEVKFIGNKS
jgi:UDP-N-acetylmuramate dehydrogenase